MTHTVELHCHTTAQFLANFRRLPFKQLGLRKIHKTWIQYGANRFLGQAAVVPRRPGRVQNPISPATQAPATLELPSPAPAFATFWRGLCEKVTSLVGLASSRPECGLGYGFRVRAYKWSINVEGSIKGYWRVCDTRIVCIVVPSSGRTNFIARSLYL